MAWRLLCREGEAKRGSVSLETMPPVSQVMRLVTEGVKEGVAKVSVSNMELATSWVLVVAAVLAVKVGEVSTGAFSLARLLLKMRKHCWQTRKFPAKPDRRKRPGMVAELHWWQKMRPQIRQW